MSARVRLGVIGWLYHYDDEHALTVAACDVNGSKLEQFAKRYPAAATYTDWRRMAAEAELDAVLISTPNWLHREMAEDFLARGVHVFVEKPMGVNREEIDSLVRAQRAAGKILAVDFEMRVSAAMNRVREIVDAGEIGRLNGLELVHHRGGWLAEGKMVWRTDPDRSGGLFFMEGCHAVDIFRCLAGEVSAVQCFAQKNVMPQYPPNMPDNVCAHLWLPDGVMGTILTSHTSSVYTAPQDRYDEMGHDMYWIITGTEGCIRLEEIKRRILLCRYADYHPDAEIGKRVELSRLEEFPEVEHFNHDIAANHRAFLACCHENRPFHQDTVDAWKTHVVCLAAERSAVEGFPRTEVDYALP